MADALALGFARRDPEDADKLSWDPQVDIETAEAGIEWQSEIASIIANESEAREERTFAAGPDRGRR